MAERAEPEELTFKQISATAIVIPGPGGTVHVEERLYGLGDDGRVFMYTDHGWVGMLMHKSRTTR